MRYPIQIIWMLFFLISCGTSNRIVELNDSNKKFKSLELMQKPETYSSESGRNSGPRKHLNLKVNCLFQKTNKQSVLSLVFRMKTPAGKSDLDSILLLDLDHEKVKLISANCPDKKSATPAAFGKKLRFGPNSWEFHIPENLWISIVHSQEIGYQLYVGKEWVEVRLNASETSKLKVFFQEAIHERNAGLLPVPEGQKKW